MDPLDATTRIVGSVATVGATSVALWVAVRDGRRRDAERRDAEAGQARIVVLSKGSYGNQLTIQNQSTGPVFDVEVRSVVGMDPKPRAPRLTNTRLHAETVSAESQGGSPPCILTTVLSGGDEVPFSLHTWVPEGESTMIQLQEFSQGYPGNATLECVFRFTDASGLRWQRLNRQSPKRVLDEDNA